jgi:hypothetical protein
MVDMVIDASPSIREPLHVLGSPKVGRHAQGRRSNFSRVALIHIRSISHQNFGNGDGFVIIVFPISDRHEQRTLHLRNGMIHQSSHDEPRRAHVEIRFNLRRIYARNDRLSQKKQLL